MFSARRIRIVALATSLEIVTVVDTGRAQGTEDVIAWNELVLSVLAISGQVNLVQTRSLAMTHVAVHDALNAIKPRYEHYALGSCSSCGVPWALPEAAIAAATHSVHGDERRTLRRHHPVVLKLLRGGSGQR